MMSRIFTQQCQVVKDFKKALEKLNEREDRESGAMLSGYVNELLRTQYSRVPKSTIINAAEVLEQILERYITFGLILSYSMLVAEFLWGESTCLRMSLQLNQPHETHQVLIVLLYWAFTNFEISQAGGD